jgi:DNA-binding IclR family transcriptional regulator
MNYSTAELNAVGPKGVPALVRASRVLDTVMAAEQPLTLSALARQLNLPKSTVHGICRTLTDLGLLVQRNNNSYRIGPHVMRWASAFLAQTDLTTEFAALWDNNNILPSETITLSVLDGRDVTYIGCRNSQSPLGIMFRLGMRLPAPFTATGKAILSTMSDREVMALFANTFPAPLTPRSVKDIDSLLLELAECRRRGFSIDDEQTCEGMYCFGTAVRDATNRAVAGIAVSLLANRISDATIVLAAKSISKIAQQLSIRLGAPCAKRKSPENLLTGT